MCGTFQIKKVNTGPLFAKMLATVESNLLVHILHRHVRSTKCEQAVKVINTVSILLLQD